MYNYHIPICKDRERERDAERNNTSCIFDLHLQHVLSSRQSTERLRCKTTKLTCAITNYIETY